MESVNTQLVAHLHVHCRHKLVLKDLPRRAPRHLSHSYSRPVFLLTAKPREGNLLQSTREKFPFWNQSLSVKTPFKPLRLHRYHRSYKNTEWQIILAIQTSPFKFSIMSFTKLRWSLSFTDGQSCADGRDCTRRPSFLAAHTVLRLLPQSHAGAWM